MKGFELHPPSFWLKLGNQFFVSSALDFENPLTAFFENQGLAKDLGLLPSVFGQIFDYLNSKPQAHALAYAGHQFGNLVPSLGDGRAHLLGEMSCGEKKFELQLKGSGQTVFSRGGDGQCTLAAALKEVVFSEFLRSQGLPTSTSLFVHLTGRTVERAYVVGSDLNRKTQPGAILGRLMRRHLRCGTFEYFAIRDNVEALSALLRAAANELGVGELNAKDLPFRFVNEVANRQIRLVVRWMGLGFIHGVMNSDNFCLTGETIDFGPCAMMERFQFHRVLSSIDSRGRYSWQNQKNALLQNLVYLIQALWPLFVDRYPACQDEEVWNKNLESFSKEFDRAWTVHLAEKLNIRNSAETAELHTFLQSLESRQLDWTQTFLAMENERAHRQGLTSPHPWMENFVASNPELKAHTAEWGDRLESKWNPASSPVDSEIAKLNPVWVPRTKTLNDLLDQTEQRILGGEVQFGPEWEIFIQSFWDLNSRTRQPKTEELVWLQPPSQEAEQKNRTFCGT